MTCCVSFIFGFLDLLGARSYTSVWFWLMLAVAWTWVSRGTLGVPKDIVSAARRSRRETPDEPRPTAQEVLLLDWLSLTLPRWKVGPAEGAILFGLGCFILAVLAGLGFYWRLEMAQALTLLLVPLWFVLILRARLAARLRAMLTKAQAGSMPARTAAADAARGLVIHQWVTTALSVLAVLVTAFLGTIWMILYPFGI